MAADGEADLPDDPVERAARLRREGDRSDYGEPSGVDNEHGPKTQDCSLCGAEGVHLPEHLPECPERKAVPDGGHDLAALHDAITAAVDDPGGWEHRRGPYSARVVERQRGQTGGSIVDCVVSIHGRQLLTVPTDLAAVIADCIDSRLAESGSTRAALLADGGLDTVTADTDRCDGCGEIALTTSNQFESSGMSVDTCYSCLGRVIRKEATPEEVFGDDA